MSYADGVEEETAPFDEETVDPETGGDLGNDTVTYGEIAEIYADLSGDAITRELGEMHAAGEAESRRMEAETYEEPRAAAIQGRKTYNTGPKGVLTDYEEAKLKMRARRIGDGLKREDKVYMAGSGDRRMSLKAFRLLEGRPPADSDSSHADGKSGGSEKKDQKKKSIVTVRVGEESSLFAEDRREQAHRLREQREAEEERDEAYGLLDDDNEVMKEYRARRTAAMDKYKQRYGGPIKEIRIDSFHTEIDEAPSSVTVVLCVQQDYLPRCQRFLKCLETIAQVHRHVKFLHARSDRIALKDYPEVGLPTVIVFRNGEQVKNLVGVHLTMAGIINDERSGHSAHSERSGTLGASIVGLSARMIEDGTFFTPRNIERFLIDSGVLETEAYLPEKPTADSIEESERLLDDSKSSTSHHGSSSSSSAVSSSVQRRSKVTFAGKTLLSKRGGDSADDSSSDLDLD